MAPQDRLSEDQRRSLVTASEALDEITRSTSRGYAVRGLRAFAEAMTAAWSDEARAVEGRPDAQEEAVALDTMHAAKGLEWPIVVPIDTMTWSEGDGDRGHRKSDVDLACETLERYRAQVRAYLDATGAEQGLIVVLTSGTVISVV